MGAPSSASYFCRSHHVKGGSRDANARETRTPGRVYPLNQRPECLRRIFQGATKAVMVVGGCGDRVCAVSVVQRRWARVAGVRQGAEVDVARAQDSRHRPRAGARSIYIIFSIRQTRRGCGSARRPTSAVATGRGAGAGVLARCVSGGAREADLCAVGLALDVARRDDAVARMETLIQRRWISGRV